MLSAFTLCLVGCARSDEDLSKLVARGSLEADASLTAETHIVIRAPQRRVWAILVDKRNWEPLKRDNTDVAAYRSTAPEGNLSWSLGVEYVPSHIVILEPATKIAWSDRLLNVRAVHICILTALPDGRTEVRLLESMSGWPISILYSSETLVADSREWLARLKEAAESNIEPPGVGFPSSRACRNYRC